MSNIKLLSLFTWIGAFEYALILLKHIIDVKIVWYSEIDKFAIQTYKKNFPRVKNYWDIRKIDTSLVPQYDILVWWSPCQDFSINGKRKWVEWDRWSLLFEYLRILKDTKPKYFIFENVKGLLNQNKGKDFELLKKEFDHAWYNIVYQVLNSKNFWLPQNRERVFIIGMRKDLGEFNFKIPTSNGKTSLLKDILDDDFEPKYYRCEERIKGLYNSKFQSERWEHIDKICHCLMASWTKKWIVENRDVDFINRFNKRQLDIKELDWIKVRQLTPMEYEKIQGFPTWYTSWISDSQRYKQLWNSISINVLESIFKEFFLFLNQKEEKMKSLNKNRAPNTKKVLNSKYDEVEKELKIKA